MSRRLIALDLPAGPGFVSRLLAAWEAGDAILPIDQRLPRSAQQALLERLRPHVIADPDGDHQWPGASVPIGVDDAAVIATSGTTGVPKGVVLTHQAIAASAVASAQRTGATGDDHWLACLPLSHIGGLSVIFRSIHDGATLTVLPKFDPDRVRDAARAGANLVSLVPTALSRIDPAMFDTILLGGSAAPADRPSNTVVTYGMTETGSGIAYDRRPLDGVEMRTVGGELSVRGPMLLRCYRGGQPFEHAPIGEDGWFDTGDLGTIHEDGTISVQGRRADLIISGGENVWPEPVEAIIANLDGVADVLVAGAPDPEWGQVVTAHIVTQPGHAIHLEAVREAVKDRLPAYCAPKRIEVHDHLPRTAIGKPQRHLLSS